MSLKDLTGNRHGKLVVLKRAEDHIAQSGRKRAQWLCRCDCGAEKIVVGEALKQGRTRSCGCWQRELMHEKFATKDIMPDGRRSELL